MRRTIFWLFGLSALGFSVFAAYVTWLGMDRGQSSRCHGSLVNGSLEGGRRPPYSGANFRAYSLFGFLIGRTFMHAAVQKTVMEAYAALEREHPELRFVYAESAWPWGGRFAPHKTHANGTAVDFHVPVRTRDGEVAELPTSVVTLFGYGMDFDKSGQSKTLKIDFRAMALHLQALERAARANGISISRVIFDVDLQPRLRAAAAGLGGAGQIAFNRAQAWVRHDEHYHVEFGVSCR